MTFLTNLMLHRLDKFDGSILHIWGAYFRSVCLSVCVCVCVCVYGEGYKRGDINGIIRYEELSISSVNSEDPLGDLVIKYKNHSSIRAILYKSLNM